MCRAVEHEQPIYLLQTSQLNLPQRSGLLQPAKALFKQASPAQADGISGLTCGCAVQVAAAPLVVLRNMRRYVQSPRRAHKSSVSQALSTLHGDAARVILLLLVAHQQGGIALR